MLEIKQQSNMEALYIMLFTTCVAVHGAFLGNRQNDFFKRTSSK